MMSFLKTLSFLLAVGLPSALFAQLVGAPLPASAGPGNLFIGFVASVALLIVIADYTRQGRRPARLASGERPLAPVTRFPSASSAQPHRLAA